MGSNYIPFPDGDFVPWVNNFSSLITDDPTVYGLTSGDATAFAALVSTFVSAYNLAKEDDTRSSVTVAAKDTARANVEYRARQLAGIIQANPAVDNEQKTALGITVRKSTRSAIGTPTTIVLMSALGGTSRQQMFAYSDQATPDSKSKPYGSTAAEVSMWVAPIGTAPTGPPTRQFDVTRTPFRVEFESGEVGKQASLMARWKTATGLLGPWSSTVTVVIS